MEWEAVISIDIKREVNNIKRKSLKKKINEEGLQRPYSYA
jgi:hypothetical protein